MKNGEFKIQSGIPVAPIRRAGRKDSPFTYTLAKLKVGQSLGIIYLTPTAKSAGYE